MRKCEIYGVFVLGRLQDGCLRAAEGVGRVTSILKPSQRSANASGLLYHCTETVVCHNRDGCVKKKGGTVGSKMCAWCDRSGTPQSEFRQQHADFSCEEIRT